MERWHELRRSRAEHAVAGRLGEPVDIARAVVFHAADEASFITGSTLPINGRRYMI
jgi:NAD(P)-dependent dehydrogenase (short-subunit alcohol dehydrogenase family)